MHSKSGRRWLVLAALTSTLAASGAGAETFTDGATAFHVWTVPGAVKRNGLASEIVCTNIGSGPTDIGVRFLDATGTALNDFGVPPPAGSTCNGAVLGVPAFGSVSIANSATAQLHEDCVVTMAAVLNGAAKIFSSSKTIACTAFLLDRDHAVEDPVSGLPTGVSPTVATLKVMKARKQNGD